MAALERNRRGLGDVMLFSVRQHPDVMLGGLETSGNTVL